MATTAALVGAGQRGFYTFGAYARSNPDALRFVAVVDPDPGRRERFSDAHPGAAQFATVDDWLAAGRLADIAIVASPDRAHFTAASGALRTGYDVLLEKPMAASLADSVELVRVAAAAERTLAVAHVLRYTPFFRTLHEVIASGRLGEIITVEHRDFHAVDVSHTVPSIGFTVRHPAGAFAVSGDTRTNKTLWPVLNACEDLRALVIEGSFPDEQRDLADVSGHYCPLTLVQDLEKLEHEPDIWLTGMKPGEEDTIYRQMRESLPERQINMLTSGIKIRV